MLIWCLNTFFKISRYCLWNTSEFLKYRSFMAIYGWMVVQVQNNCILLIMQWEQQKVKYSYKINENKKNTYKVYRVQIPNFFTFIYPLDERPSASDEFLVCSEWWGKWGEV